MPINAGPEYIKAEKSYLNAGSLEDRIYWLEEMIKTAPKHKGSENLLAELKTRLKKFREKAEKGKKTGKGKKGIRKEGYQFALVGFTNSGKSSLLAKITNATPKIGAYEFTTKTPELGTLHFKGVKAQVVDLPSLGSEEFDVGIANTADCLLLVVHGVADIKEVEQFLTRSKGKRIVVITRADLLSEQELRKLHAKVKSKRIHGVVVSTLTGYGLEELQELMIREMGVIRIYTKEPGKVKANDPVVLPESSTVKDVAEAILKGFSRQVRETRLTGPSGKFPNQRVGLTHKLKDLDVVEFHT